MPFDISGVAPGLASRRIRMAQPYGGSGDDGGGTGMSFPLLKGTEVIWTCIDGDIDRPIITGAVPNPLKPSVTNTQNANSNVIKTTSGITMGFHDGLGGGAGQGAAGGDGSLAAQQQNQSINFNQYAKGPEHWASSTLKNNSIQYSFSQQGLTQQQQMMAVKLDLAGATLANSSQVGTGKQWSVVVPDYDDITGVDTPGSNDSYLRLGKSKGLTSSDGLVDVDENLFSTDGWLDFTDGNHVTIANGNRIIRTEGNTDTVALSSYKYDVAASTSYAIGAKNWHSLGISTKSSSGMAVSANFGINVAFHTGYDFTFSNSRSYSFTKGKSFTSAGDITQEGKETVCIKVDPDKGTTEKKIEKDFPDYAAAISVASAVVSAGIVGLSDVHDNINTSGSVNRLADVHGGTLAAMGAALAGYTALYAKADENDKPATSIDMDAKLVSIQANGGKGKKEGHIILEARSKFDDKKAAKIKIDKIGDKGTIVINAGSNASGSTASGSIELKVGEDESESSIIIKDKSIVFICDGETFTFDAKGLTLKTKDITLEAGSILKAKEITATGKIETDGDIKGKKLTYTGLDGPCKVG
jgi:hypothetical protein